MSDNYSQHIPFSRFAAARASETAVNSYACYTESFFQNHWRFRILECALNLCVFCRFRKTYSQSSFGYDSIYNGGMPFSLF
jgi:hypothetical protein